MSIPNRIPLLLLEKEIKERLRTMGFCLVSEDVASMLLGDLPLTKPVEGLYSLCDDRTFATLSWQTNTTNLHFSFASWRTSLGPIRDQKGHLLCWIFAGGDLVSAKLVQANIVSKYMPLCPWYLCYNVKPDRLGSELTRTEFKHNCYGGYIAEVFAFVAEGEGAPRQEMAVFDCLLPPPSIANRMTFRVTSWCPLRSLEEACLRLEHEPIGASLIVYSNLWECKGKEVYYGALKERRERITFEGYHDVAITNLEYIGEELVARCKMSNGTEVGDLGYALVSLSTVFMFAGVRENAQARVRATPHPTHLLSNFVVPILEPICGGSSSSSQLANY